MLWLHMRVSICKKPFFDVVVLCSGNKNEKNENAAFHLHRPAVFLSVVLSLLAVAAAFHSHRPAALLSVVFSLLAVAIH